MEAIPKFVIKYVIKFDISIKPTTWMPYDCTNTCGFGVAGANTNYRKVVSSSTPRLVARLG